MILGIRPSDFDDAAYADPSWPRMAVTAGVTEELGSEIMVIFTIDAPHVEHAAIVAAEEAAAEDEAEATAALVGGKSQWTARVAARSHVKAGQRLDLAVDTSNLHFFDPGTGLVIGQPAAV